jgi:3-hydroxymyristoyl/3-hydroxydecanoyl-(acyl carrier protein) dehydratase
MFELIQAASFDGDRARGRAVVPAGLPMLADHIPGVPIVPRSLQLELASQIAGPLAEQAVAARDGVERWGFLGMVRHARFDAIAPVPAELAITAELRRLDRASALCAVTVERAGAITCRAELVIVLREAEPAWADAIATARARLAAWKANP